MPRSLTNRRILAQSEASAAFQTVPGLPRSLACFGFLTTGSLTDFSAPSDWAAFRFEARGGMTMDIETGPPSWRRHDSGWRIGIAHRQKSSNLMLVKLCAGCRSGDNVRSYGLNFREGPPLPPLITIGTPAAPVHARTAGGKTFYSPCARAPRVHSPLLRLPDLMVHLKPRLATAPAGLPTLRGLHLVLPRLCRQRLRQTRLQVPAPARVFTPAAPNAPITQNSSIKWLPGRRRPSTLSLRWWGSISGPPTAPSR